MASSVVTPEDVLETLMNDGTIDAIRLKIINQLKANEELRNNTITMVEQSKVLNTPGAETQTKRELFDALRRELEMPVLEKASKAVWELIIDENGLGKEINETVERVFCRLSGIEHLSLPPQSSGGKLEKKESKLNGSVDKVNETAMSDSPPTRKRAFSEMNNGAEAVANGCTEHVPAESEDGAPSSSNARG